MRAVSRLAGFAAVALLAVAGAARAVPSVVNFQGQLKAGNAAFTGMASFKFALLDTAGNTLWSNDGTPLGQPAAAVSLPVAGGLFAAPLGDASLGFVPLPPSTFQADARLRVWTSTGGGTFEALSPDAVLTTAPYAGSAAGVGGVPGNSLARAAFVAGFTSGLPAGSQVLPVDLTGGGYYTGPAGTFVGFSATHALDSTSHLPTATILPGDVVLRRRLGADRSWQSNALLGRHAPSFTLILNVGGAEAVRWKFSNFIADHYSIRVGDDGQPVEEISVLAASFTRTQTTTQRAGTVPGIGNPVGFALGGSPPLSLQPGLDGTTYPGDVVVSAGFTIPQSSSGGGGGSGKPVTDPLTLRQNPTDDSTVYNWFNTNGRHTFTLVGVGGNVFTAFTLYTAYANVYTLRLADDGLPVEEFNIGGSLTAP